MQRRLLKALVNNKIHARLALRVAQRHRDFDRIATSRGLVECLGDMAPRVLGSVLFWQMPEQLAHVGERLLVAVADNEARGAFLDRLGRADRGNAFVPIAFDLLLLGAVERLLQLIQHRLGRKPGLQGPSCPKPSATDGSPATARGQGRSDRHRP
jgi:hypothetical protein